MFFNVPKTSLKKVLDYKQQIVNIATVLGIGCLLLVSCFQLTEFGSIDTQQLAPSTQYLGF